MKNIHKGHFSSYSAFNKGNPNLLYSLSLVVLLAFIPISALAQTGISFGGGWGGALGTNTTDPVGAIFRQVVGFMNGLAGRALASIAILIAGVGALFGRISWVRALVIAGGIAILFGSVTILHAMDGGSDQGGQFAPGFGTCDNISPASGSLGSLGNLPLNHICDQLRTIVNTISGSTGQGVAIIAILILGLSALFGKLSPSQVLLTGTGIALVFGAVNLTNIFWANEANNDCLLNDLAVIGKPELVLCRFLAELRGDSAKFLASIAIITLGFLAMLGKLSYQLALVCLTGIAVAFGSEPIMNIIAPASTSNCATLASYSINVSLGAIEGVLCSVVQMISGTAGRALASAAIVMLGFGAMMGKLNYTSALVVCAGIAIAFGAPHMVFIMTGVIDSCAVSATFSAGVDVCTLLSR